MLPSYASLQQGVLQFRGFGVNDSPGTGATVISTPALINNLTTSSSGIGPLDAYQGKVLNDKLESSLKSYLPLAGGTLTGHLYLNGINSSGLVGNTSKIIFGMLFGATVCAVCSYLFGSEIIGGRKLCIKFFPMTAARRQDGMRY